MHRILKIRLAEPARNATNCRQRLTNNCHAPAADPDDSTHQRTNIYPDGKQTRIRSRIMHRILKLKLAEPARNATKREQGSAERLANRQVGARAPQTNPEWASVQIATSTRTKINKKR